MKRILSVSICLVIAASLLHAATTGDEDPITGTQPGDDEEMIVFYKIKSRSDGGPQVELKSRDDRGYWEILKDCRGQGEYICNFGNNDKYFGRLIAQNPPRLIDHAREQIAAGVLEGSHMSIEDGIRYRVEWSATDLYNLTISEWQTRVDITPGE